MYSIHVESRGYETTIIAFKSSELLFCRFILIACDGLWKVFSAEEACKFIVSVLEVSPLHLAT